MESLVKLTQIRPFILDYKVFTHSVYESFFLPTNVGRTTGGFRFDLGLFLGTDELQPLIAQRIAVRPRLVHLNAICMSIFIIGFSCVPVRVYIGSRYLYIKNILNKNKLKTNGTSLKQLIYI